MSVDERVGSKQRRPSLQVDAKDGVGIKFKKDERRLSIASLNLRASIELWLLDNVPAFFDGTVPEALNDAAQGEFLNEVLFAAGTLTDSAIRERVEAFFKPVPAEREGFAAFVDELVNKILEVRNCFARARRDSKSFGDGPDASPGATTSSSSSPK